MPYPLACLTLMNPLALKVLWLLIALDVEIEFVFDPAAAVTASVAFPQVRESCVSRMSGMSAWRQGGVV